MNQLLKRSINFFAVSFFPLIVLVSCDKDMSVMLDNSATSNVGVTMVDTFTINTSTAQLWDIPSAGTGRVLVGKATVSPIGAIKSTSYFRVGFMSMTNDIPQTAEFDSLSLILKPGPIPYSFGDTTEVQTIRAHQLTESLATRTPSPRYPNENLPWHVSQYIPNASMFSEQTFDYDNTPLGTLSFLPRLRSLNAVTMRLDDPIGQDFFDRIKTGDIQLTSYENFREYFKGIALVPEENNTAIIGFSDSVEVRINYSYLGADGNKRTGFKSLDIVERSFQHNNMTSDHAGTAFEGLSPRKELPASVTGGLTYVQAGTGIVAKLSFPSLQEFLHTENMAINKAELVIETSSRANTIYPVPGNLVLFMNDHHGVPQYLLPVPYARQPGSSQAPPPQVAPFIAGSEMGQNSTYTFNLMEYIQQLKSIEGFDNASFYLTTNPISQENTAPNLFREFNTALIASENAQPNIKLRILYTKFR